MRIHSTTGDRVETLEVYTSEDGERVYKDSLTSRFPW